MTSTVANKLAEARKLICCIAILTLLGCKGETPEQRAQDRAEALHDAEDRAFEHCLHETVGVFGSASIELVRDCRAHAEQLARDGAE